MLYVNKTVQKGSPTHGYQHRVIPYKLHLHTLLPTHDGHLLLAEMLVDSWKRKGVLDKACVLGVMIEGLLDFITQTDEKCCFGL